MEEANNQEERIEQLEALLAKRTKEYNQLLEIKNNYQRQLSIQEPLLEVYRLNSRFDNIFTNIDLSLTHVAGTLDASAAVIIKRESGTRIVASSYQYYDESEERKSPELKEFCKNFQLSDSFSLIIKELDENPTTPYLTIDDTARYDSTCKNCGITSFAITPIKVEGKISYYLLALNPNASVDKLFTLSYFAPAYSDSIKRILEQLKIQKMAITDNFTGLYDKAYFNVYTSELEKNPPEMLSLIMIDLFRLKHVNDNYGHETGDLYIKTVSSLISKVFGVDTNKVFRVGGDEFAIVCPDKNKEYCQAKMNELDELMDQTVLTDRFGLQITTRFDAGYSFATKDELIISNMMIEADRKMNASKNNYYIEHGIERRK